ncbi:MAG: uroporphyrinogen-III synthase [Ilumatobacteraceae bacterium]|nr:uroporphyrinogen-III synthase [Ilumatobacteraceae bacterium]
MSPLPLSGRQIVVTRAEEQAGSIVEVLGAAGAAVISLPLIEIIEPLDGGAARDAALARMGIYEWLVVTSPNGARRVVGALQHSINNTMRIPHLAVLGNGTRQVIEDVSGIEIDVQAAVPSGEGLVQSFPTHTSGSQENKVLLVQGEGADLTVVAGLTEKGWEVTRVNAYRTAHCIPSSETREQVQHGDAVIFASGSAARSWVSAMGTDFLGKVVVIGPVTQKVAASLGLKVHAVAEVPTPEGICAALVVLFA